MKLRIVAKAPPGRILSSIDIQELTLDGVSIINNVTGIKLEINGNGTPIMALMEFLPSEIEVELDGDIKG